MVQADELQKTGQENVGQVNPGLPEGVVTPECSVAIVTESKPGKGNPVRGDPAEELDMCITGSTILEPPANEQALANGHAMANSTQQNPTRM